MPHKLTKSVMAYKYDELSDNAKEKALEKMLDINVDYEWWESTYEDARNVGLKINSFDIDRGAYCKGDFMASAEETAHKIIDNHGHDCETFKTATDYLKERDGLIKAAPKDENGDFENEYQLDRQLDDLDEEFKKSILEDYRIILSKEYDYMTGKEAIEETIRANDYDFTKDGKFPAS